MLFRYRFIFSCLLFLLSSSIANAQYEEQIKEIQKIVAKIDSTGNYTGKNIEDSIFVMKGRGLADTMQTLIGYSKKQQLVKMVYILRFSNGRLTEKFYFDAGKLICICVLTEVYPLNKNANAQTVYVLKTIHKASYFFEDEELLELHNFGKGPMDHLTRIDKRDHLLKDTEKYKALLQE